MIPLFSRRHPRAASLSFLTARAFLARGAGLGLGFLSNLVLARWLGLTGYGEFIYITSWVALLSIPSLGMKTLVLRETSLARDAGEARVLKGLIRWSLFTILGISLMLVLAAMAVICLPGSRSPGWPLVPVLGLAALPLVGLMGALGGVCCGFRRPGLSTALEEMGPPGLMLLGMVPALFLGLRGSPALALGGRLGALALVVAAQGWVLIRLLAGRPDPAGPGEGSGERVEAWRKSLVSLAFLKGISVLVDRVPVLLLGLFLGAPAVGLYALSQRLAGGVGLALPVLSLTTGPRLAELHAARDLKALQGLVTRSTLALSASALPAALVLGLGGRWILGWFGPPFRAGYPLLLLLVAGGFFNAITGTVGQVLIMGGREGAVARARTLGLALTVGLCLVLIPLWGALGAALGATMALVLWNLLMVHQVRRQWGIRMMPSVLPSPENTP